MNSLEDLKALIENKIKDALMVGPLCELEDRIKKVTQEIAELISLFLKENVK